MAEVTLEKVHDLLEKLAEYVMTQLPTRAEMDAKLALKADKTDLDKFAAKDDLKQFAAKEDLKQFATKDDLDLQQKNGHIVKRRFLIM